MRKSRGGTENVSVLPESVRVEGGEQEEQVGVRLSDNSARVYVEVYRVSRG